MTGAAPSWRCGGVPGPLIPHRGHVGPSTARSRQALDGGPGMQAAEVNVDAQR